MRACIRVHLRSTRRAVAVPTQKNADGHERAVVSARPRAHAGPGSGQRHDCRGQPAAGPERAGRILSDRGSDGGHRRHQCHGPRRGGGRHLPTGPSGAAQAPSLATSFPSLPSPFRPPAPSLPPSLPPSHSLPPSLMGKNADTSSTAHKGHRYLLLGAAIRRWRRVGGGRNLTVVSEVGDRPGWMTRRTYSISTSSLSLLGCPMAVFIW